jgi:hypothetical protein
MGISTFILMPLIAAAVLVAFRRGYFQGLCFSAFLLVLLPNECFIEFTDALPVLSGQRLVLIILLVKWWQHMAGTFRFRELPFHRIIVWITATCAISTLLSVELSESLNKFLSLTVESFLFFAVVMSSVRTSDDAVRLLRAVVAGLTIVGGMAVLERYGGIDLVAYIQFQGGRISLRSEMGGVVFSSYPHPILMGAALAMGMLLCVALIERGAPWRFNRRYVVGIPLMAAGIYLSFSRGPWAAAAVGFILLYALGTKPLRSRLHKVAAAALVLAMLRPGVMTSISDRFGTILRPNESSEGSSAQYRVELWFKAWHEITKAGHRFVFGYGDGSHRIMDLSGQSFFSLRHDSYAFRSWDSEMACILLQRGVVGLTVLLWLYVAILKAFWNARSRVDGPMRDALTGFLACMAAYLFMSFSVKLFSIQFQYVFWSMVSAGMVVAREAVALGRSAPGPVVEPVLEPAAAADGTLPA